MTWRTPGRRYAAAVATVTALAVLAACGGADESGDGETITIRVAHALPTTTDLVVNGIDVWMKEVEERTDGKVEFEYYPGGQLVGAEELYSSLQKGVIDVAAFTPAVSAAAELPLSDVPTVPGFDAASARASQAAFWELLQGDLYEEEWKDQKIRPVFANITGLYQFNSTDKPQRTLEDFKGSSIRSPGGVLDYVLEGVGAASVNIPGAEVYEALQRGTVDGALLSIESFPAFSFEEVLDAASTNAPLGGAMTVMAISDEAWEKLPDDVQTAMNEASEVAQESVADSTEALTASVVEETGEDVDYYELSESDLAELAPVLGQVRDRWIKEREDKGLPGQAIADSWAAALEAAAAS